MIKIIIIIVIVIVIIITIIIIIIIIIITTYYLPSVRSLGVKGKSQIVLTDRLVEV